MLTVYLSNELIMLCVVFLQGELGLPGPAGVDGEKVCS